MAGFLDALSRKFGLTKSKEQGDAPARRQRVTPLGTEGGQFLSKTLRDRIGGIGTGFSEQFLSDTASPFAASQRAGLKRETIPQIGAQASSRGLGRSSIPVSQIGRESSRTEESIANRIAQLGFSSEQLKASQISEATGRFQKLVGSETQAQNAEIQAANLFDNAEFLRQQGFREKADAAQQEGIQLLMNTVVGAATGGAGFLPGVAAGGAGQGAVAGFAGDFGLFKPPSTGAAVNIFGQGGNDTGAIVSLAKTLGVSVEELQEILGT